MNYEKIYLFIIKRAKDKYGNQTKYMVYKNNKDIYLETHHIVPKYNNGTDDVTNLVHLTAKEHYVAHHLLYKMEPTNPKATCAWHMMWNGPFAKNDKSKLTGKQYEMFRTEHAKVVGVWSKGRTCTAHAKSVASKTHKGKKISPTQKERFREYSKNKTQKHKDNLAISNKQKHNKACVYNGVVYVSSTEAFSMIIGYTKSISSFRRDLLNNKYVNMYYVDK